MGGAHLNFEALRRPCAAFHPYRDLERVTEEVDPRCSLVCRAYGCYALLTLLRVVLVTAFCDQRTMGPINNDHRSAAVFNALAS